MNSHRRRFFFFIFLCLILLPLCHAGVDLSVPYLAQPDNQTCLPTCLTMVLHYMDKVELTTATVFQFQKRTRYDRYNLPGIVKDYGLYALPCWYELGWDADTLRKELDAGHPIITGCDVGAAGHFVLITGYTDEGKWIINDPTGPSPGYNLGGPHHAVEWEDLNWRGGAFIHAEPFPDPMVSAIVTDRKIPERLAPGEKAEIRFDLKNNGKTPWQEPLYLECIERNFTRIIPRASQFYNPEKWISPSRVMSLGSIQPGETKSLVFEIKAPEVKKPGPFTEYWTMLDSRGQRLSREAVSGPGLFDMNAKILVEPDAAWALPLAENPQNGKPSLPWHVKFGSLEEDHSTTMTGVLRLLTPGKIYDCAWVGDSTWTDYKVEALVYCEYRPELKPKGWDRVGIFIRDNGDHAANTSAMSERGEYCCMTFDSDDGRIRAGYVRNGVTEDFHPKPYIYMPQTGWHRFAIRCNGEEFIFELDGNQFHTEKYRRRKNGSCGVFYTTRFPDPAFSHGVRFAQFKALP